MIKYISFFILIVLFVTVMAGEKDFKYIGVKKCVICHKSEKQGKQKDIWEDSKHSKTYTQLSSKEGLEKAKKLGVDDPAKSEKCLSCHAPEFDKKDQWDKRFKLEDGVQCESCHGPGSEYKSKKVMKDRKAAVAKGLILGDEKTCLTCHKKDNPEHKGSFDYKSAWEKIKHPVPEKKS